MRHRLLLGFWRRQLARAYAYQAALSHLPYFSNHCSLVNTAGNSIT
jgi:hypothetical protein